MNKHSQCRKVTNARPEAVFLPARTATELTAFLTNTPPGVTHEACCPAGFVMVPGNAAYGIGDFCIMQFEAKNVGGVATSQAAGSPWHSISYYEARRKCQALGTGFDLPTNNHWQVMARNLESVAANWSGGAVGSGCMYVGNTQDSLSVCEYMGPQAPTFASGTTGTGRTKARLQLTTGEHLWDVAANVAEYVQGVFDANQSFTGGYVIQIDAGHKTTFGPAGTYTAPGCAAAGDPTGKCGLGWYGYGGSPSKAVHRGGSTADNGYAGVFWVHAAHDEMSRASPDVYTGFRCVYDAASGSVARACACNN